MEQKLFKFMPLNIQLFAENGEEENANDDSSNLDGTPLTFDEILEDKEYQKEFDRRINKALDTAKSKWEKEYTQKLEAEKTEAEKLAKMDAEQKHQYELEQALKKASDSESKLRAYELKEQATKIASEKNVDISLLELIDFTKENAESVATKIDNIKSIYDNAIEKALNEKLKQKSPVSHDIDKEKKDPFIEGFLKEFNQK